MSDPKCARLLLDAAERDILTLRSMTALAPDESFRLPRSAGSRKGVQFKAWLALLGQVYPLRHDLYDLLDLLDSQGAATGFFRQLATFTPYAVQFRYEGLGADHDPINRDATLSLAEALVQHVRDQLARSV